MEDHNIIFESNGDEEIDNIKDQNLELTRGKMGEVREENDRLKFLLASLVKDYQSLQTTVFDTLQQGKSTQEANKVTGTTTTIHEESDELVSLSLGVSSSSSSKGHPMDEKKINSNRIDEEKREDDEDLDKGLALGLDIRFDPSPQTEGANNPSPESSFVEGGKEEEPTEMWPPSKVLKTMKAVDKSGDSHQQTRHKKARVSIRARCDTQTMNDGCQWRKYGQKIAKGNPCPRAYYRCTVSPSCPVRKQVQRCAEDMSILITTYEGTHNHPLPISATAMASTTSAAASMLQSPSLSSQQGLIANSDTAPIINSITSYNTNALNFSTFQISSPHQFYFPNSSISTPNNSHPTITLDLTAPPNSSHSGNFTSGFSNIPKYSTNLSFSSTFSPLQSSLPQYSPWSTYSGYFNSGKLTQNRNHGAYVSNSGSQPFQGHLHQPIYMSNHTHISQQPTPDSIAAATKAITANPKFQSALATALTTYVGNGAGAGGGGRVRENDVAERAALNLKPSSGDVSYTSGQNGIGCASSRYLFNAQQGNSIIFPPPPPAVSKGSPGSSSNRSNQFLEQGK